MMLNIWRVPYSPDMARRFGLSLVAVPLALIGIARSRRLRALASLPVAAVSTALTGALAWTILTNVLAYPFRPYLGVHSETRDIWADRYVDSWGGPTLAGAWATHGLLVLALLVPAVAWTVRGLGILQSRLTRAPQAAVSLAAVTQGAVTQGAVTQDGASEAVVPQADVYQGAVSRAGVRRRAESGRRSGGLVRVVSVVGAVGLAVGLARLSHAAGIGDNVLWLPHKPVDAVALAVTVAPLAALPLVARSGWWRAG